MSLSPIVRAVVASFSLTVLVSIVTTARAQQPSAQMGPEMMKQQADAMEPMITRMTRITLQTALDFYAEPATAKKFAAFSRNYLDSLVAAGFTREEAVRIVAAHGLPALPGAGH